jgi:segregation and condensation protein B
MKDPRLSALLEAIVYLAEEPVRIDQIQKALPEVSREDLVAGMEALVERFQASEHGIEIREVAGGYRISTKPEHHEVLKAFAKSLVPPTRLSLPALETLAVIAYRQPITVPEIQEIRGVQASGVIRTLLDRKLVTAAGRKDVIGRPILYKTTRNFLIHFGLNDLSDLPSIEEFEEILKASHAEGEVPPAAVDAAGADPDDPVDPAEAAEPSDAPGTDTRSEATVQR